MQAGGNGSDGLDGGPGAIADAELIERIGFELRASYRALMEEPVPEHLLALIRRLGDDEGKDDSA